MATVDYSTPPNAKTVEAFLKGATFWPTDPNKQRLAEFNAQLVVDAALNEWENLTGYTPFLASTVASTRTFYIDSKRFSEAGVIPIDGGLARFDSATFTGAYGVPGGRFIPKPDNAVVKKQPITWLHYPMFRHRGYATSRDFPLEISVTGLWGYATSFPPAAYNAINQRAAVNLLRQIENQQSLASISQDSFSKEYDIVGILTQKDVANGGDKDFIVIAERFQRKITR